MDSIASYLGVGRVNARSKEDPEKGYRYDIGSQAEFPVLIGRLDELQFMSEPKYYDYCTWKRIISMVQKGYHLIPVTHQLIVRLAESMHKYGKVQ